MRNLKTWFVAISFLASFGSFAESSPPAESPVETVKSITAPVKREARKKKAVMCEECGKPEIECECAHKEEQKKKEK